VIAHEFVNSQREFAEPFPFGEKQELWTDRARNPRILLRTHFARKQKNAPPNVASTFDVWLWCRSIFRFGAFESLSGFVTVTLC